MKQKKYNVERLLIDIVRTGNKKKKKSVSFCLGKLLEEAGELSQAAHAKTGAISKTKLKHKDQVYEEACDALILVLDTVGRVYRKELTSGELTDKQIIQNIMSWAPIKMKKWKKVEGIKD